MMLLSVQVSFVLIAWSVLATWPGVRAKVFYFTRCKAMRTSTLETDLK